MKKYILTIIIIVYNNPVVAQNNYPDISNINCELNQYHIKNSKNFDKKKLKIKKTQNNNVIVKMGSRYYSNVNFYYESSQEYFYEAQWIMQESAFVPYTYYDIGPYYFTKVFLILKDEHIDLKFKLDHKKDTFYGKSPAPTHYYSMKSINLKFDKNTFEKIINEKSENIKLYMQSTNTGLTCVKISSSEFEKLYKSIKAPL
jgi:hypothetical protein